MSSYFLLICGQHLTTCLSRWVRENVPGWEQAVVCSPDEERSPADHVTTEPVFFRTSYGRKNRFLELSRKQGWNRVGHLSHKMLILIFKAGIDFFFGSSLPHSRDQFHDGIDSHTESIL
jgi:hypothetical protein